MKKDLLKILLVLSLFTSIFILVIKFGFVKDANGVLVPKYWIESKSEYLQKHPVQVQNNQQNENDYSTENLIGGIIIMIIASAYIFLWSTFISRIQLVNKQDSNFTGVGKNNV